MKSNKPFVNKVLNIKVFVAREGISMAVELGWNKIVLEGYSKSVIDVILLKSLASSVINLITNDIICLGRHFLGFVPLFDSRSTNMVAHWVAGKALDFNRVNMWEFSPPPWLVSSLVKDSDLYCLDTGFLQ
ncbi:hypothetical protein Dimus_006546 [Dionaea muscipula]